MSHVLPILQVDAFTDRPFAGNPAGVVLEADGLSESQMQRIAAEMNVAQTAFVSPTGREGADLRLRWFTPTREVKYCGHATVATTHALVEAGRLQAPRVVFDTLGGLLPVGVEPGREGARIWLEPAVRACAPFGEPLGELLGALGLPTGRVGEWAGAAVTPDTDLLLPARDLDTLGALAPDLGRLGALAEARGLRGICAVALQGREPGSTTHSRFFAPHYGIPEDPVSGSVHSSIALWLLEAGRLRPEDGLAAFTAEQGDFLGRPGRLRVEVRLQAGRATAVRVGGRAVTVLHGSLRVP